MATFCGGLRAHPSCAIADSAASPRQQRCSPDRRQTRECDDRKQDTAVVRIGCTARRPGSLCDKRSSLVLWRRTNFSLSSPMTDATLRQNEACRTLLQCFFCSELPAFGLSCEPCGALF